MKDTLIGSLYARHSQDIKKLVSFKYNAAHDADDIVQETFKRILTVNEFEQIENPSGYLYRTAKNLALNRIRNQAKKNELNVLYNQETETPAPEFSAFAQIDLEKIEVSIKQLPKKYQRSFLLSRVEHKTHKEIADILGISTSTVEKHIMATLKFLSNCIGRN
ncbi:MAG: sigma-70 family RNA polymerase sigma factor [Agarilytica sp.]